MNSEHYQKQKALSDSIEEFADSLVYDFDCEHIRFLLEKNAKDGVILSQQQIMEIIQISMGHPDGSMPKGDECEAFEYLFGYAMTHSLIKIDDWDGDSGHILENILSFNNDSRIHSTWVSYFSNPSNISHDDFQRLLDSASSVSSGWKEILTILKEKSVIDNAINVETDVIKSDGAFKI